jgi:hypothetical protein
MIGDDSGKLGPKMLALPSDRMRAFVLALLAQGTRNYTAAYKAAGYSGTMEALRVGASRLAHDERVLAALHEEASKRLHSLVPAALRVVEEIMENPDAKDRAKVALGVLDRAGLHTVTEQRHTHSLADDTEMLARIRLLAERNGIPLANLLGGRLAKTIEGECVDMTPAAVPTQ